MAAKNKQRKKSKTAQKVTFQEKEHEPGAENSGGEEEEDSAADEGKDKAKQDEEELSLDEILLLGGTQVSLASCLFFNVCGHKYTECNTCFFHVTYI